MFNPLRIGIISLIGILMILTISPNGIVNPSAETNNTKYNPNPSGNSVLTSVPPAQDREGLQYLYNDTKTIWDSSKSYRYDWEHDRHYLNFSDYFGILYASEAYIQLYFHGEWTELLNMTPKYVTHSIWFCEVEIYEPGSDEYPLMYRVKLVENETSVLWFTNNAIFCYDDDLNAPEVLDHGSTGNTVAIMAEEYSVWVNVSDDFSYDPWLTKDVPYESENGSGVYSVEFSWYDGSVWTDWELGTLQDGIWVYTFPETWKEISNDYYMVFQVRVTDNDNDRVGDNTTAILGVFHGGQINVLPLPQGVVTFAISVTGGIIILLSIRHWRKRSPVRNYEDMFSTLNGSDAY